MSDHLPASVGGPSGVERSGTSRHGSAEGRILPQLDGMRALAILLVFIAHWVPFEAAGRVIEWGRIGMVLFFTLSGFLITGILLRCRDHSPTPGTALRAFYIRRTLRIFPIYYTLLAVLLLLGYEPVRKDLAWHLTYLANFSAAFIRPEGTYFAVSHLWSLCVEEQFYLLWGPMVLYFPPKGLWISSVAMIGGGIAFKLIGSLAGLSLWQVWVSTPGNLGLGALLAILLRDREAHVRLREWLLRWGPRIGLPGVLVLAWAHRTFEHSLAVYGAFFDISVGLIMGVLLESAAQDRRYALGALFSWAPLRYVGKISYGLYLFHQPVRRLLQAVWVREFGVTLGNTGLSTFLLATCATVGVAVLSWHLFENPINRLRGRFRYCGSIPGGA